MAETFNSVLDQMMNNVAPVDYTGQVEGMINRLMESNEQQFGTIKPDSSLNGQFGQTVNKEIGSYNQLNQSYNDRIKYYDDILNNNKNKKQFIKSFEDQGYQMSKSMRDGIEPYHQNFIKQVNEAKQATMNSFSQNKELFDSMFKDMTNMSTSQATDAIKINKQNSNMAERMVKNFEINSNKFAENTAQDLEDISKAIASKTDVSAEAIRGSNKQKEVKQIMDEHKKWAKDMQRGRSGMPTESVLTEYKNLAQRKDVILNTLDKSGAKTDELVDQINNIFDKASSNYEKVLGEAGELNTSVASTYIKRTSAMERITQDVGEDGKRRRLGNKGEINYTMDDLKVDNPNLYDEITNPKMGFKTNNLYNEEMHYPKMYTDKEVSNILEQGRLNKVNGRKRIIEGAFDNTPDPLSVKRSLNPFRTVEGAPMGPPVKAGQEAVEQAAKKGAEEVAETSVAKKLLKRHGFNSIINGVFTIADYKESRREGDGVLKSAAKAGVNFAIGETLGLAAVPFYMASSLPSMAVKGVEGVAKMNREMNAGARMQPFAEASFQDTQQLATMRQSGMEMAKMSQYNLQQTIMGNEAQYLR